jgi:hypothetical protein
VVLAVLVGEGLSPVVIQVSVLYRNAWEQTCVRFQIFFFLDMGIFASWGWNPNLNTNFICFRYTFDTLPKVIL